MSSETAAPTSEGHIQVRIAEPDGSSEVYFKIALKKPLERMFMIWTQKRNETKATNSSFEFIFNERVLAPTDLAENCAFARGSASYAHVIAKEILKAEAVAPLPHRWPFRHDNDFSYMQELVRALPSQYVCPLMPFPIFDPANVYPAPFGHDMQQANFLIDTSITYLNHGSYGATPRVVLQAQQKWQQFMESNCCRFFNYQFSAFMAHAIRTLASFIGASPESVVFVDNATTGVETVIKSLKLQPTDSLLYLSIGYGPIINFLKTMDLELIRVECKIPLSMDQIVDAVLAAVKPNTKIAILDHITSGTGAIMPLERIISKLQEKGVFVMIDGAHAVGQIPLNLTALHPDAYVSNCHKWLYSSKGCAFLWVSPNHDKHIFPLVRSSGTGLGLTAEFGWSGTKDYTPYLSVMTAIELYNYWGADRIRSHSHNWVIDAAEHLMSTWGVRTIFEDDPANPRAWRQHVGAMVTLELPATATSEFATFAFANQLKRVMLLQKGIDFVCYPINGKLYLRLSGQIYLDKDDYIMFAEDLPRVLDNLILAAKAQGSMVSTADATIAAPTSSNGPEDAH